MKNRVEIRYNQDCERYELWEVIYDPDDLLYPVQWSNFLDFHKNKKTLEYILKNQFHGLCMK